MELQVSIAEHYNMSPDSVPGLPVLFVCLSQVSIDQFCSGLETPEPFHPFSQYGSFAIVCVFFEVLSHLVQVLFERCRPVNRLNFLFENFCVEKFSTLL